MTVGGSGLDWHHLASQLRPDGLGRCSFVGNHEIRFNTTGRQFDTAVIPAGTYLAACTAYAALYRKSPVGLDYSAGLDAELATLLQAAAWETSQDCFKP